MSEDLTRAARIRAALIALFNNDDGPLIMRDVMARLAPTIEELGYTDSNVYGFLAGMVDNGLLAKYKQDGANVYCRTNLPAPAPAPREPREPREPKPRAAKAPEIQVDLIKGTGKIRLQLQGFTIVIGVTDE